MFCRFKYIDKLNDAIVIKMIGTINERLRLTKIENDYKIITESKY